MNWIVLSTMNLNLRCCRRRSTRHHFHYTMVHKTGNWVLVAQVGYKSWITLLHSPCLELLLKNSLNLTAVKNFKLDLLHTCVWMIQIFGFWCQEIFKCIHDSVVVMCRRVTILEAVLLTFWYFMFSANVVQANMNKKRRFWFTNDWKNQFTPIH